MFGKNRNSLLAAALALFVGLLASGMARADEDFDPQGDWSGQWKDTRGKEGDGRILSIAYDLDKHTGYGYFGTDNVENLTGSANNHVLKWTVHSNGRVAQVQAYRRGPDQLYVHWDVYDGGGAKLYEGDAYLNRQ